eukprot:gene28545-7432_t
MARTRCEQKEGECETHGLLAYPKCNDSFHNVGCCVCTPDCPAGWDDIGVSCRKPVLPSVTTHNAAAVLANISAATTALAQAGPS